MKLFILILSLLFLSSCLNTRKATAYLDKHEEDAAKYCAVKFPVKTDSTTTVTVDSASYLQQIADLNRVKDSALIIAEARNEMLNALQDELIHRAEDSITSDATGVLLRDIADKVGKVPRVDVSELSARIEARIRATIRPCRDTVITKTVVNTAEVRAEQLRADRLQTELDGMKDSRDNWRKWCLITWGLIAVYVVIRIFASRLGIIGSVVK